MSHFAKVDFSNPVGPEQFPVLGVIVIEQDVLDQGRHGNTSDFVQTSYNTHGGVHSGGGTPLRKNYAGIGDIYDRSKDAFYAPQPFASWTLDEETCLWQAPVPYPDDGKDYVWDEATLSWVNYGGG